MIKKVNVKFGAFQVFLLGFSYKFKLIKLQNIDFKLNAHQSENETKQNKRRKNKTKK